MSLQHLRSSTANKRPVPGNMSEGQMALNTAASSPGLFYKDSAGALVKVGPVHVGTTAPNASPASGGTAGNSVGEQWLDTTGGTYVFKVWDGSAWRSENGEFVNVTGDTMTGSLTMGPAATLIFEGSVDDGFETTLTIANPTADRTITLPNITGTVVTTGDTGTVTSTMIADGTIVNADVNASAAIAGTKISPDFGSQNCTSTGTSTAASFIPTSSGAPANGLYLSATNTVALATNSTGRLFIDALGQVGIGEASPRDNFHIAATNPAVVLEETDAGTDEKCWRIRAEGSILRFEGVNDAFSSTQSWLNVTRSTASLFVDSIAFSTGGVTERARIDSSGRLLVGASTARTNFLNTTNIAPKIQVEATGTPGGQYISVTSNNDDPGWGGGLIIAKSRGAAVASNTVVQNNDELGFIEFQGADGTRFVSSVRIEGRVDGPPSAGDMPGRLVFSTTSDAASSATERLRVTSDGYVRLSASSPGLQFNGDTAAANALDDYEEGTFTPTVTGSSTAGTGTYNTNGQVGRYTKIGNRVSFTIYVDWSAHTGTGNLRVSGLPFTSNSAANAFNAVALYAGSLTYTGPMLQAYFGSASTTIIVGQMTAAGVTSGVPMDTAANLTLSGHYEV